jgi:hypothetical protein
VHIAATQDPLLMQTIGQNPQAQKIIAAAQAHIAEHLGFAYRAQMEQVSGQKFPPPGEPIPPEQEAQLSRGMMAAAKQLLESHKQQAAQQQAAQAAQDPVVQAQQADIKIKMAEVDRKTKKDEADNAAEQRRLDIMEKQIDSQQENVAFQGMTNAMVQKTGQNAQQENTAFTGLTGALSQAHGAAKQAESQAAQHAHDLEKQHAQGAHTIANTVIGHMIAGQKNAGPKE